nr:MAG TPA: hypothetical protein [Caudoviricetes sp.]
MSTRTPCRLYHCTGADASASLSTPSTASSSTCGSLIVK